MPVSRGCVHEAPWAGRATDTGALGFRRGVRLLQRVHGERKGLPEGPQPGSRTGTKGHQAPGKALSCISSFGPHKGSATRQVSSRAPESQAAPREGGVSATVLDPRSLASLCSPSPRCLASARGSLLQAVSQVHSPAKEPPLDSLGRQGRFCHPGPQRTAPPDPG